MRPWLRIVGLLVVAATLLAACGGPGSDGSGAVKELVIAQGVDPQTLDPHRSTVQQALNISMAIAEPLIDFDYQTGELKPRLAVSWKNIDDVTWEIKLREGVSFTNGEPFTAESVKVSIERIKKPELKSPATIYVRPIVEVKVVDDHTVHIITDGPSAVLPLNLTRIGMVPPGYLREKGDEALSTAPVGTGPFKLVEWQKDERVVLEANPDYWGGRPPVDRVIFRSIPAASTRVAALRAGEADIITSLPLEEAEALNAGGEFNVESVPSLRLMMVQFNLEKEGPHQDVRVRQALNYAVDKQALVDEVLSGYGGVLDGQPLSREYFGHTDAVDAYPYDPDKARQLLAEAGYSASNPLRLTLYAPTGRYMRDKEVAEAIAGQLRAVGVDVRLEVMEWGLFLEKMLAKELSPLAFWGAATVPDADVWLGSMATCGAAYSAWCNKDFDALVRQAGRTLDEKARLDLYERAVRLVHEQAPFIFLYQQHDVYGVSKRVQGFVPNPDESIDLLDLDVTAG